MNPLVTIIVPSYNHVNFIEQCLISIIKQTHLNKEIIVIDDGSLDGSVQLLGKLQKSYDFKLALQDNQGVSKTLNKAIRMALGEYICLCASDDYFAVDKIEKLLKYIIKNPGVAAVSGSVIKIKENGEIYNNQFISSFRELTFEDFFVNGYSISAASLIHKETIINLGLYDENYCIEDLYMWLKMTKNGYKVLNTSEITDYQRVHRNNSSSRTEIMCEHWIKIINDYSTELNYNKAIQNLYFRLFINCTSFTNLNKKLAFKYLTKLRKGFLRIEFIKALIIFMVPQIFYSKIIKNKLNKIYT